MPNASSPTRLALLVALLLAPGARAEGAPERDPCGAGDWRLDGADAKPGPGAVFNPDWLPALDQVVACLNRRPDSCLEVRGHFDTVAFGPGVEAAFGSAEAVQLARAHGRAAHVIALLHDRGVAGLRLRLQPPSMEPTWRGVGLKLVERCQAMAAHPPV
ncbi:MAG: hypothetical protein KC620_23845, partial [Myxococcales bacterium]|nr:hypothetical protein [Myxococcales bacterium]